MVFDLERPRSLLTRLGWFSIHNSEIRRAGNQSPVRSLGMLEDQSGEADS